MRAGTQHWTRIPVLGVMTTFWTNAPEVLQRVEDGYGSWHGIEDNPELVTQSRTAVTILVDDHLVSPTGSETAVRERLIDPDRLLVMEAGAVGIADAARLESHAYVASGLVASGDHLFDGVIEPLTLFLLCRQDRQPLHATGITRGSVALLLAGPSGTGKSTLAYAASRHGFGVLADEPIFIQLHPRLRVWGRRRGIRLPVSARSHFPELDDIPPTRLPGGKTKIVVPAGAGDPWFDRVGLCLLRRDDRHAPGLEALAPERAVAELTAGLDPGFDLYASTIPARIATLAERGAWRLTLGDDPRAALPLLERAAEELERRSE